MTKTISTRLLRPWARTFEVCPNNGKNTPKGRILSYFPVLVNSYPPPLRRHYDQKQSGRRRGGERCRNSSVRIAARKRKGLQLRRAFPVGRSQRPGFLTAFQRRRLRNVSGRHYGRARRRCRTPPARDAMRPCADAKRRGCFAFRAPLHFMRSGSAEPRRR
jgi:hypothetical protein